MSDRSRGGAEKGGRKWSRLEDGGVGTGVEGEGRDCGGGEGCVEESLWDGLHQVILQSQFGLEEEEQINTESIWWRRKNSVYINKDTRTAQFIEAIDSMAQCDYWTSKACVT